MRSVLTKLREAGLTASPKKCQWGGKVVQFLGHKIGDGKISIPENRVEAVRHYVKPRTRKGLRRFLGIVGFYRKYIDMLAKHTAVLSPATAKASPNIVDWTEERSQAFHAICESVCIASALVIPLPQDEVSLVTDASGYGLGAVLQVRHDGVWEAATFYSRQTRGPERRYSASELEALAVVEAVRHFSHYLYGRKFVVFTNHKPLCALLTSDHLNSRLKRFSMKLQPWMVDIHYFPVAENVLADALSRQDWRDEETVSQDEPQSGMGGCGGPPH